MLEQIKKISETTEDMRGDMHDLKTSLVRVMDKIDQYSPEDFPLLKQQLSSLESKHADLDHRMRDAEVQANILKGKWAILAIFGGAILSLSLTALGFVLFHDKAPSPAPPPVQIVQQPALPAKDIKYESIPSPPR